MTLNTKVCLWAIAILCLTACDEEESLKPTPFGSASMLTHGCPEPLPNITTDLCGLYEVPLDWTLPEAQKIDVFLRSFLIDTESRGQLWVIDGGPGASGATFSDPRFVELIHKMGWDLYLPMHRGVGFSTQLDCGLNPLLLTEANLSLCSDNLRAKYGEKTNWFSAVGAAYDLHYLIQHNNPDNLPVIMMGTSYGTFLTQRFLQLFENSIDAAVLVSGTNLDPRFETISHHEEQTFRALLNLCDQQPDCQAMFTTTAYEAAQNLIIEDGWRNCHEAMSSRQQVSDMFRGLAASRLREKLPLSIKWLTRCNAGDIESLTLVMQELSELEKRNRQQLFQFNPLMNHHQIFMELLSQENRIPSPPRFPQNALLGQPASTYVELRKAWVSRHPPLSLPSKLSATLPILALHGGLDMQASINWFTELSGQLLTNNQFAVLFPTAGHGTPSYTALDNGENCSWLLVEAFLADPYQALDLTCVDKVNPLVFITD